MPSGVREGTILFLDAMPAALLAQVLTQQLAGERIDQANVRGVPLHSHAAADPTGRRAVIGRLDFHAAIEMHGSFAVLVIAERFQWQRQQRRFFLGEHHRYLALGGAGVDARVGLRSSQLVQMGFMLLPGYQTAGPSAASSSHDDAGFDFALAIRIAHAARQRDCAVVLEHIAIQRSVGS